MHARCLARELKRMGIDAHLSSDPSDLVNTNWDVIHTHGTGINIAPELAKALSVLRRGHGGKTKQPIRIHAFHGTTLGRMAACREWSWPGGYVAAVKEFLGLFNADIILADHADLFLYDWAKKLGKKAAVISNGWDSFVDQDVQEDPLPYELTQQMGGSSFWVYYGRGSDCVKGVDRLIEAIKLVPGMRLVASPGEGFEDVPDVIKSGNITQGQLRTLSSRATGLVLTSRYEGLPLVIVEALGLGMPVVSTPVGGVVTLPHEIEGLFLTKSQEPRAIADAIKQAMLIANGPAARTKRANHNQQLIPSWHQVAQAALKTVEEYRAILRA